jgi:hypothetical protein
MSLTELLSLVDARINISYKNRWYVEIPELSILKTDVNHYVGELIGDDLNKTIDLLISKMVGQKVNINGRLINVPKILLNDLNQGSIKREAFK